MVEPLLLAATSVEHFLIISFAWQFGGILLSYNNILDVYF